MSTTKTQAPTTIIGATAEYLDERAGIAKMSRGLIRKVFPDHWSFMLGEMALWSFVILLLTGTWLSFFFTPSMGDVVYNGSYMPLHGVTMSEAYSSTLHISFDIRGGLLIRQIHHWAALIFVASIVIHSLRVFFTGAFRKPRELNWLIGNVLLILAILEGFIGYSLPDDLLSGTGIRIAEGILLGIPIVGSYLTMFLFGGQFPGTDIIPRFYIIHVLLIPGIILALITIHLFLIFYQKHTQFAGPGRTEKNVVGAPFMPIYLAKAGGWFFLVFGICSFLAAFVQINPIWSYGPYKPDQISAGSQPDWYMGFLEGSLRIMPNWEWNFLGHTVSFNVLLPALVLPGILFTLYAVYPFIEAWVTGDRREHHLLDRPRNMPVRTGLGVMAITDYVILWLAGGNDILATHFHLSLNSITWTARVLFVIGPPIAFMVTKRICLGLQRRDRDKVLHGRESGTITRLPHGEFVEIHEPLDQERLAFLTAHEVVKPIELGPAVDKNGVAMPHARRLKVRAALSHWYYGERIEKPTVEEYKELVGSGHGGHH